MPSKVKVFVVKRGEDFFVQPPIVSAEKSDSLRIINTTGEDLMFHMKDQTVLKDPDDQTQVVSKKATIELTSNDLDGQKFEYLIVMLKSGKTAQGNSDPVLIIDN